MTTSRTYRFAVQGGPFGDPVALRDHARRVEALGYDELFTSDHVGAPGSGGRSGGMFVTDPFGPLIVSGEATTRLRLGPLVLNTELYKPALLARTVATADRLTGGRLVLGLGTGYSAAEHDSIGAPIRAPGPRVSRFEEVLVVLRALLDDGAGRRRDSTRVRVGRAVRARREPRRAVAVHPVRIGRTDRRQDRAAPGPARDHPLRRT